MLCCDFLSFPPSPPKAKPLEEKEEEESLPDVSLFKILSINGRQWWLLLLGTLGAMLVGAVFPLFAIIFGEVLGIFALPSNQILGELHPWAAGFLALGVAAAIGQLVKVGPQKHLLLPVNDLTVLFGASLSDPN